MYRCSADVSAEKMMQTGSPVADNDVFILGSGCPAPFTSISCFHSSVLSQLRQRSEIGVGTDFQRQIWSIIYERRNTAFISADSRGGGKTLGYLLPLVSFLLHETNTSRMGDGLPRLLILVPGFGRAEKVAEICRWLIKDTSLRCERLYAPDYDLNNYASILNGCDILVATPPALVRAIGYPSLVTLEKCKYLVLDSATQLLHTFHTEISCVLEELSSLDCGVQFVVSASSWTSAVEKFLSVAGLLEPVLVIHPWSEVFTYRTAPAEVIVTRETEKLTVFSTSLVPWFQSDSEKTLVFCADDDEVARVTMVLRDSQIPCLPVPYRTLLSLDEILAANVLIATDQTANRINFRSFSHLVHFSMSLDLEKFSKRARFFHKRMLSQQFEDCRQTFFVTEENNVNADFICMYLKKAGVEIPNELKAMIRTRRCQLCPKLKSQGICLDFEADRHSCTGFRHKITRFDRRASALPKIGDKLAVEITEVLGGTTFVGRIVKTWDSEEVSSTEPERRWKLFSEEMTRYFEETETLKHPTNISIGDHFALKEQQRCSRVEVMANRGPKFSTKNCWLVFSVDEGWRMEVSAAHLFQLPDSLGATTVPSFAVEIVLAGIRPLDKDSEFSSKVVKLVKEKVHGRVFRGEVSLALGSTIWMEPMVSTRRTTGGKWVNQFDFGNFLAEEEPKCAERNPEHIHNLLSLCSRDKSILASLDFALIPPPRKISVPPAVVKKEAIVRHAFLHMEPPIVHPVLVSAVETPGRFFVQLQTFQSALEQLQRDIESAVNKKELAQTFRMGKPEDIRMEHLVACKHGGKWMRARIKSGNKQKGQYLVFFVDYGSSSWIGASSKVYDLSDSLIAKLPFQAIECSLADLKPAGIQWASADGDLLREATGNNRGEPEVMLAKVRRRERSENGEQDFYTVKLVTEHGESVAEQLMGYRVGRKRSVACGFVDSQSEVHWKKVVEAVRNPSYNVALRGLLEMNNSLRLLDSATQIRGPISRDTNAIVYQLLVELCRLFRDSSDFRLLSLLYDCLGQACEQNEDFRSAVWVRLNNELPPPKVLDCKLNLVSFQGAEVPVIYLNCYRNYTAFMLIMSDSSPERRWSGTLCRKEFIRFIVDLCEVAKDEIILSNCCQILSKLALQSKHVVEEYCEACVVPVLSHVVLEHQCNDRPVLLSHVVSALTALCSNREETKEELCDCYVPEKLLRKMNNLSFVPSIRSLISCMISLTNHSLNNSLALWTPRVNDEPGVDPSATPSLMEVLQDIKDKCTDLSVWELINTLVKRVTNQISSADNEPETGNNPDDKSDSSYWSEGDSGHSPEPGQPRKFPQFSVESSETAHTREKLPDLMHLGISWSHPPVLWSQSGDNLKLTVELRGIQSVELWCNSAEISFRGELEEREFKFCLKLFAKMIPSQCSHQIYGSGVVIKLVKLIRAEWPRLTESSEKLHFVRPDLDVIYCPDTGGSDPEFPKSPQSPLNILPAFLPVGDRKEKPLVPLREFSWDGDETNDSPLKEEYSDDSSDEWRDPLL